MNCIGLFCEDIREEIGGTHTIVGVMPDNVNLQGQDVAVLPEGDKGKLLFPKMGFYVRANLDANAQPPSHMEAEMSFPGHGVMKLGVIGTEGIEKAFKDAHSNNLPFVGVVFKAVVAPLPIAESGIATLHINVDGRLEICGALNIRIIDQSAPNASPPPS